MLNLSPRLPRSARPRRGFSRAAQPIALVGVAGRVVGGFLAGAWQVSAPAIDRVIGSSPRYFVHGTIATISVAALAVVAVQPRPAADLRSRSLAIVADQTSTSFAEPEPTVVAEATAPTEGQAVSAARPPAPKPSVHVVEEGETLRMLAAKYGVSTRTIMAANGVSDPDLLKIGQELVILPTNGVLHTLRGGESLRQIAQRYEVDLAEIVAANDFANPDVVAVGTELLVPGAEARVTRSSSVAVVDGEQRAAQVVPPIPVPEAARRNIPSPRTYEVQRGDTLVSIAETFGLDVATILSSNGIDDPDTIKPGSELRLLPVTGLEYEVKPGEKLADIAWKYQVDLGLLLDYNDLDNPDVIRVGLKLVLPNGKPRPDAQVAPAPAVEAPAAPRVATGPAGPAVVAQPAPKPAAKPAPAPQPAPAAPVETGSGGSRAVLAAAMQYRGYRYVFGGTSPAGFDCSGFVYYVHRVTGNPVGRGMWQQYNGGQHIPLSQLLPGDTVFFANTYMPGMSHNGIYIGGGQFIHASDESTGVTVSSMNSSYWSSRYVGATRLWS